jgi:cytochrome c biogenesis protein
VTGFRARAASGVRGVAKLLRRPSFIVSEIAAVAAGATLAASLPQQPDLDEMRRFAEARPALGRLTAALGLHDVVTSAWFLVLVAMCFLSLVAVQAQQWPRLKRTWAGRLDAASFARAPYRRVVPVTSARSAPVVPRFSASGRLGLLGSPVFHLGLLVVMLAGLVRLLTFRDAVGRAFEGDVLPAAPGAFEAERGGWLSRPLALPRPVRVDELRATRYASGALEQLTLDVTVGDGPRAERHQVAVNSPLDVGRVRLYVMQSFGLAAPMELVRPEGATPLLVLLEPRDEEMRGGVRPGDGLELRVRARGSPRPASVELRALVGGVLLGIADLAPGSEVAFGPGLRVRLHGLGYWARIRGGVDPSRPLFFAGVSIAIVGIALMFGFTRVDSGVFVDGGLLVVALRPQRFAPLYAHQFERLCQEWIG